MLRPEFFKVEVTKGTTRYGFGLLRPNRTRRFLATVDVFDRRWNEFRTRGAKVDVRLFG